MSNSSIIECKPSKWFKTRACLILLMLAFFTAWFVKDGYSGYRQKNLEYVTKQLFTKKDKEQESFVINAIEEFNKADYTAETWEEYAGQQILPTPPKEDGLLPRDYDYSSKWPDEIINGYAELKEGDPTKLWKQYSGRMKWSEDAPKKLQDAGDIRNQYISAGVAGALFLFAALIVVRTMRRSMVVTDTSYISPSGIEIPFASMRKIDKRKWDNKGLALIYYEDDEVTKKAKVDGMVYGYFKKEDGAPAEALFQHILDNFKGDLIDYETDSKAEEEATENVVSDESSSKAIDQAIDQDPKS